MKVRFDLVFRTLDKEVARVHGIPRPVGSLTVGDIVEGAPQLEQLVEKLTGIRCHVETMEFGSEIPKTVCRMCGVTLFDGPVPVKWTVCSPCREDAQYETDVHRGRRFK